MQFVRTKWLSGAVRGPGGIFRGGRGKQQVVYRLCFVAPSDVKESDDQKDEYDAILRNHFKDMEETIALSDADFLAKYGIRATTEEISTARAELALQLKEWGPTATRTVAVCRLVEVLDGLVSVPGGSTG